MKDNMISQAEIDALLNKSTRKSNFDLSIEDRDILGEIGNISMSTAATALSEILNKKVSITTPKVTCEVFSDVIDGMDTPKVIAVVSFKEGLTGSNVFMVDIGDAAIIADLMMGGDGDVTSNEIDEIQQSAVAEAMNQMIGSASTAMSTLVGKGIDINPPIIQLWEADGETIIEGIDLNSNICKIEFDLVVEGLIESKIMQFYLKETVEEVINSVKNESSKEEVINIPEPTKKPIESNFEYKEKKSIGNPVNNPKKEPTVIKKPIFNELVASEEYGKQPRNLDLIMDVPLEFSVVLGKSKKTIKEILSFGSGSVIELNKQADEALEIYVNGKLIAQGEVVVINENFGIRITNIISKEQRIKGL